MRININKRILKVGSLPDYESIVQIDDPNQIRFDTPYRLFVRGLNSRNRIIISRLEIVSKFDGLM